jgi:hypothetical protein
LDKNENLFEKPININENLQKEKINNNIEVILSDYPK